jgi:hypothetical protein
VFGFITPNTFLRNKYAAALRDLVLSSTEILRLRLYDYGVFPGASVDTAVMVARRTDAPQRTHEVRVERAASPVESEFAGSARQSMWNSRGDKAFDLPRTQSEAAIIERITVRSTRLGEFATAYFGIQTHGRKRYVREMPPDDRWKPALDGRNIQRYSLTAPTEFVSTEPSAIKSGGDFTVYERQRIGVRQIGKRPVATLVPAGWYSLNTIYNIYFTGEVDYSLEYVLGILLSQLLGWYWEQRHFDQKQTFPKIKKGALLAMPVRTVDFADPADVARHQRMVTLVERILELHKRQAATRTETDRELYARQIEATDREIDRLVYKLYGLTENEIAIVEGAVNG